MMRKEKWLKVALYASYIFIVLVFLFPLFWTLSISLKTQQEIFEVPPSLIPTSFAFENYLQVLETTPILTYLWNSFRLVGSTVIVTLLIAVPAAFALSRYQMKHKSKFLVIILMTQMISAVVITIPLYRLYADLDMLNNFALIVLVYVAVVLPFSTWFLKNYFDTLPVDLDEAAIIDGCTKRQVLTKILLPVAKPGIISVLILVAVQSWSQFVIPFILIDDAALYPVSVGVINLQETEAAITTHYLAAGSILSIVPVIILFLLLQRYIVGALTTGAVKG
ncbi:multiple sugar transport system permease protein [Geomicrobium halophilum]|uniref:Multiple sugar transport system permease protein n=1 Tax=Geomicrobium halophilum TaxID=549000 RepID=A0A841Q0D3_9BACL|nr:carbohydrate ABC transporter permease [Geomicrobium halophilum]MBB6450882.1 multiple sugar transport system permease protein [Geomicrobium halophilum]